jgi:NADH-quinone oxidoreductase subunit D
MAIAIQADKRYHVPAPQDITKPAMKGAHENMVINMGPHHPSTHGVLRLVVELDGETVLNVAPDIGFLHTGI